MKCNVCGKEFGNGAYCQNCGSDIITARGNYGGGFPLPDIPKGGDNPPPKTLEPPLKDNTMICYRCAEVIPSESDYCPCCGIKLFVECPKCGHKYSSQYTFCNKCGTDYQKFLDELRAKEIENAKEEEKREKEREEEQKMLLRQWRELTGSDNGTTILESKLSRVPCHLTIPNGITKIGKRAFSYCSNLISISIPNSVTVIEAHAFNYCKNLKCIEIPYSVTEIQENAFFRCDSLTSINIPDRVSRIGAAAFYKCISLAQVKIPTGVTKIEVLTFSECMNLSSVEIPDSVTIIDTHAFGGCPNLKNVVIPHNCYLDKEAFDFNITPIRRPC